MRETIKSFRTKYSGFYSTSILFSVISIFAAATNYITYPLLVRIIGPEKFGDYATISAISNQLLVILSSVNIVLVFATKKYGEEKSAEYMIRLQRYALFIYMALGALLAVSSTFLKARLSIESGWLFVILLLILITAIPSLIWTGYLQGKKELVRISVYTLVSSIFRLLSACVLGYYFGSKGAVLGILFGAILAVIVMYYYPGVKLNNPVRVFSSSNTARQINVLAVRPLFITASIATVILGVLQNLDILVAKALFEPYSAGLYSSLSVLSNALYFVSFMMIWIVLPEISLSDSSVNRRLLRTTSIIAIALYTCFVIGSIIFSSNVLSYALDIPLDLGTLMFALSYQCMLIFLALYSYYGLSLHRLYVVVAPVAVALACIAGVLIRHPSTPFEMIQSMSLCGIGALLITILALRALVGRSVKLQYPV